MSGYYSKDENYFTEKLIDCFRTGTVPIYWGSNSIKEHFDMNGIICFETIDELNSILPTLTSEKYAKMKPAINENYKLSNRWTSMDDTFAKTMVLETAISALGPDGADIINDNKDLAIEYAKKNKIEYELIEPQNRKIVKKSYSDNFIK